MPDVMPGIPLIEVPPFIGKYVVPGNVSGPPAYPHRIENIRDPGQGMREALPNPGHQALMPGIVNRRVKSYM